MNFLTRNQKIYKNLSDMQDKTHLSAVKKKCINIKINLLKKYKQSYLTKN